MAKIHANVPAETMLLAIFYNDPTQYSLAEKILGEEDFTTSENKMMFQIFRHIYQTREYKINIETVLSAVRELNIDHDQFDSVTKHGKYIEDVLYYNTESEDVYHWLELVKRETYRRAGINELKHLAAYLDNNGDDLGGMVQRVEDQVLCLGQEAQRGQEVSTRIFEGAQDFFNSLASEPMQGVDIGLPIWQKAVGLLRNRTVHLVVAYTKTGKSQFAVRAGMEAAKEVPVLYCDSEMDEEITTVRGFCYVHQIPFDYIEYGWWGKSPAELRQIEAVKHYARYCGKRVDDIIVDVQRCGKILKDKAMWYRFDQTYTKHFHYLDIKGVPISKALHQVRRWLLMNVENRDLETRSPQCLVIIDQIKLHDPSELQETNLQEFQYLGVEMSKLHDFAKGYNLPVICLGQTNSMGDVQGAKRMKDTASSVSVMMNKNVGEFSDDPQGNVKLEVQQSRRGALPANAYINLGAKRDRCYFQELGIGGLPEDDDDDHVKAQDRYEKAEQKRAAESASNAQEDEDRIAGDDDWTGG